MKLFPYYYLNKSLIIMGSVFGHTLDIRLFGINPDSTADQTELIQNAINQAATVRKQLYFPNGTYYIKAHVEDFQGYYLEDQGGLALQDNSDLFLENDAKFYVIPNNKKQYNLFRIYNKKNVKIKGGIVVGDRYSTEKSGLTTGEWGYGIAVSGGENVYIEDVQSVDMWGDGINLQCAVTTNTYLDCKNIQITNVRCSNNRRQGMSIESGIDVIVQSSIFEKTNGTGPGCGIDVEISISNSTLKNIIIQDCIFKNNHSSGLTLQTKVDGASVLNCKFENNTDSEGQLKIFSNVGNIKIFGNTLIGDGSIAGGASLVNGSDIQFSYNTIKNGFLKIATVPDGSNNSINITDNFFSSDFSFWSPFFTDGSKEISINFKNNIIDYRNVPDLSNSIGLDLRNLTNSNLTDNKFYNIVRITIAGNNNIFKNNLLEKTVSTCIIIAGNYNNVVENKIIDPCYVYENYPVFNVDGNFNSISQNTIEKTTSTVSQNLINLSAPSKGNNFFPTDLIQLQ